MATSSQPKGRTKANFDRVLPNTDKYRRMAPAEREQNDKLPLFRGTISAPENPDEAFEFAVWPYVGKSGKPFLAGPVRPLSTRAGVEDHLTAARMTDQEAAAYDPETGEIASNALRPNSIILRLNRDKITKDDPTYATLSDEERASNEKRPLYWAKWQRGPTDREVRASYWDKVGRYGPYLEGSTQYPMSRAEAQRLDMASPERDEPAPAEPTPPQRAPRNRRGPDRGR